MYLSREKRLKEFKMDFMEAKRFDLNTVLLWGLAVACRWDFRSMMVSSPTSITARIIFFLEPRGCRSDANEVLKQFDLPMITLLFDCIELRVFTDHHVEWEHHQKPETKA
jgi:hypothetical protein